MGIPPHPPPPCPYNRPYEHVYQKVIVKGMPEKTCQEEWDYYQQIPKIIITDNMICAYGIYCERDTCDGDSGGPLIWENRKELNRSYLVGVTSMGKQSCKGPMYPAAIYAKVASQVVWIAKTCGRAIQQCLRGVPP
jgi:secreted trypsin-like serine protease